MVKFCILVVARLPAPVRKVALLAVLAEMDAVGVFPAILRTANLAEAVEVPPMNMSQVLLSGERALFVASYTQYPVGPQFNCVGSQIN